MIDSEEDLMEESEGGLDEDKFNATHVESLEHENEAETGDNDIKVLIATDIHVGYTSHNNKRITDNDALVAFEEVLQIARREEVDMVLLGGDLFHENNPSRDIMCKVTRLLRRYCLNDRDVLLEFVSDPSVNFCHSMFPKANYEDENLNIGLPIFTIHGNHDDMAAKGLTALDELHESGLINLFGKFEDCEKYEVSPILLRKGTTRLALYGIGSQRDDRLNRAFESASIKFLRPRAEAEGWFNLLTLHQNRPPRSTTRTTGNYLPVKYIPSFFDVVLWGHEHECKIRPEYVDISADVAGDGFFIIQPGSTVATSLTAEEALDKHVSVLTIRGRKFQSRPIRLETPRQLLVRTINIEKEVGGAEGLPPNGTRLPNLADEMYVKDVLRSMLTEAAAARRPRQPPLPLVRLNLIYSGPWAHMTPLSSRAFYNFSDEIANPHGIVSIKRQRKKEKAGKDDPTSFSALDASNATVEDLVSAHYAACPVNQRLTVLTDDTLKVALRSYVHDTGTVAAANRRLEEVIEMKMANLEKKLEEVEAAKVENGKLSSIDVEKELEKDLIAIRSMLYTDKITRRSLEEEEEDDEGDEEEGNEENEGEAME